MTRRTVLDIGQCDPDHDSISRMLDEHFDVEIVRARLPADAIDHLRSQRFDLVFVNRKLDADYSDGIDVIRNIKADPDLKRIPVMLLTNLPEHQELAVAAGAEPGFGKAELGDPEVVERLSPWLGNPS